MVLIGIALFCALVSLLSAVMVFSIIRLNKGAKVNAWWLLTAVGHLLVALGITAPALLKLFNMMPPGLGDAVYIGPVLGSLLVLIGHVGWRRTLGQMVK